MLRTSLLIALTATSGLALPAVNSSVYFINLASNLTAAGLTSLLDALMLANITQDGQNLIDSLYSGGDLTFYAPVDEVSMATGIESDKLGLAA